MLGNFTCRVSPNTGFVSQPEGIDQQGKPSEFKSKALKPGRHRIMLMKQRNDEGWKVNVWTDDSVFLTVNEPREWGDLSRSFGSDQFSISEQLPADKPVILFRRHFLADDAPWAAA